MALRVKKCEHIEAISDIKEPLSYECAECVKIDGTWLHLRTCQECGRTLCCDSSPNTHASTHSISMGHPVIISAETNERWMWCYEHEILTRY